MMDPRDAEMLLGVETVERGLTEAGGTAGRLRNESSKTSTSVNQDIIARGQG